jgi:hypothetical protein
MAKKFNVVMSNGSEFELEASGFADAAAKILCEPGKYPLPKHGVVGIEGPHGARFYLKREDSRNLWPISAATAATFAGA